MYCIVCKPDTNILVDKKNQLYTSWIYITYFFDRLWFFKSRLRWLVYLFLSYFFSKHMTGKTIYSRSLRLSEFWGLLFIFKFKVCAEYLKHKKCKAAKIFLFQIVPGLKVVFKLYLIWKEVWKLDLLEESKDALLILSIILKFVLLWSFDTHLDENWT